MVADFTTTTFKYSLDVHCNLAGGVPKHIIKTIDFPRFYHIIHVDWQHVGYGIATEEVPHIWIMGAVDDDLKPMKPFQPTKIHIFATGEMMGQHLTPENHALFYTGTVLTNKGTFVWHIFREALIPGRIPPAQVRSKDEEVMN